MEEEVVGVVAVGVVAVVVVGVVAVGGSNNPSTVSDSACQAPDNL